MIPDIITCSVCFEDESTSDVRSLPLRFISIFNYVCVILRSTNIHDTFNFVDFSISDYIYDKIFFDSPFERDY